MSEQRYRQERARIEQGHVKYREKLKEEGKLFVRDRLKLLLDPGTEFQEDFLLRATRSRTPPRTASSPGGRSAAASYASWPYDYTVKAGSWGEKTIQKIVRIQERAQRLRCR